MAVDARGAEEPTPPLVDEPAPDRAASRAGTGVLVAAGAGAGLLNYAFVIVVAALLAPDDFVVVAAGQGILLVVGSAAATTLPWLTAQRLATARGPGARRATAVASIQAAVVMAAVVSIAVWVASPFAAAGERVALVAAAALVCGGQVATGWAQGQGRYRLLAGIVAAEVVVKVGLGASAALLGFGATGVFSGAVLGGALLVVLSAVLLRPELRGPRSDRRHVSGWWHDAAAVGLARSTVAALGVVDVVLLAVVLAAAPGLAPYQLAMSLGRVPVFLATAVGQAWLRPLVQSQADAATVGETWRRFLVLALPAAAAIATVPPSVAGSVLPGGGDVVAYLPAAAVVGLCMALVQLACTWGQAAGGLNRLVGVLLALLVLHAGVVLVASALVGLRGVAVATAASAVLVGGVLCSVAARPTRWRPSVPVWAVVSVPVLAVSSAHPAVWMVATVLVGLLTLRQLRVAPERGRHP